MTLQDMIDRESSYQAMIDSIVANRSVSHILGSDWGAGVSFTDKKAPYIALATELFSRKFGDVTAFGGHQYRS